MEDDSRDKINAEVYEHIIMDSTDPHVRGPKLDVRVGDVMVWLNRCESIIRKQAREQFSDALRSSVEKFATEWISTSEAAEILGVSRIRVNQLIKEGQLVAERVGNRYCIEKASVEERAANPPGPGRPW